MGASLEPIRAEKIFLLRSGNTHDSYREKQGYTFSALVTIKGNVAEIKGGCVPGDEKLDRRAIPFDAIKQELRSVGVTKVFWERVEDGEMKVKEFDIEDKAKERGETSCAAAPKTPCHQPCRGALQCRHMKGSRI